MVFASNGTYVDRVQITWNRVIGATAYEVWRSTANNSSRATRLVSSVTAFGYNDTSAVAGQTYYYWVKAKNTQTVSQMSTFISRGYRALRTPRMPTGLSASKGTYNDRVRLTWNAVSGATDYEVWRHHQNSSASAARIAASVRTTHYEDTNVVPGQFYYYWVRARNAAGVSPFSASDRGYAGGSIRYIDLTVSLYRPDTSPTDRAAYEDIFRHFADAVFEMTNGAHRVRTIEVFHNSSVHKWADIVWNSAEWPRAKVNGVTRDGYSIFMGDVFPFPQPVQALVLRRYAGYVLAHELGHYYYGLYDEYQASEGEEREGKSQPRMSDKPVEYSIMNDVGFAVTDNDMRWLNFSVAKRNTKETAQHRMHGASAWETLVRSPSLDTIDWMYRALFPRRSYPELSRVAPGYMQDASVELPENQALARRMLYVKWNPAVARAVAEEPEPYLYLESVTGQSILYPEPLAIVASAILTDPIAYAGVTASVEAPDGSARLLTLADDGLAPDVQADDGLYTGLLWYSQNGIYTITVSVQVTAGVSMRSWLGYSFFAPPFGEDEDYSSPPDFWPIEESFAVTGQYTVSVAGVVSDDHGNTIADATDLPVGDVINGRINNMGDVDVFRLWTEEDGLVAIRVGNLAFDTRLRLRIVSITGEVVFREIEIDPSTADIPEIIVEMGSGQPLFVEIRHSDPTADKGYYEIHAESREYNSLYLPMIAN